MTTDRDQILDEMIQWWISRKNETTPSGRIRFDRSSTTQATIRIPTKMYNDAMIIAHADPNIKNFSRFCEMLIWEKLGKSSEYLKSPNQESVALASGIPEEDGD
ncbi:MAG: hypothetical protein ACP5VS_00030 [Desulfomonilaceae bacterium]